MKHNFRELLVWKKSCEITSGYPKEELFGLTSQIRRCAVSIPSNISEGCGLNTDPQLLKYLHIAHGSSCELETQMIISKNLNYLSNIEYDNFFIKINEIQKMIIGFKKSIKSNIKISTV